MYAVAWPPKAEQCEFEVLYRADIERHRAFSAFPNGDAWTGSYGEMGERSAINLLCKRLPKRPAAPREDAVTLDATARVVGVEREDAPDALEHKPGEFVGTVVPTVDAREPVETAPARPRRTTKKKATARAAPAAPEPEPDMPPAVPASVYAGRRQHEPVRLIAAAGPWFLAAAAVAVMIVW